MQEYITSIRYESSFNSLKDIMHQNYLNDSGGTDSSWMIPRFTQFSNLMDVVKHSHAVFKYFVNYHGSITDKYDEWVYKLYCITNNNIIRVLAQKENITYEDVVAHLVNLRPGKELRQDINNLLLLYSDDNADKEKLIKLSKEFYKEANKIEELLAHKRIYGVSTNEDKINEKYLNELIDKYKAMGYMPSKFEDTRLPLYEKIIIYGLAAIVLVSACVCGFAFLGFAVFFLPLLAGKFK